MKRTLTPLLLLVISFSFGQNKVIDSLQALLSTANGDTKIEVYNDLSLAYRTVDFDKSYQFAKEAQQLARTSGNKPQLARGILNAGVSQYLQGNHGQALDMYLTSLRIYDSLKEDKGSIAVLNELGTLEKKNGDLVKSEAHLLRALELSKNIGDSAALANSMNNIGHVYELKSALEIAMKFYSESAKIKEALGDFYGASYNYDNMGNLLSKQGKFDEAQQYFEKEIKIFGDLNDRAAYAVALNNMGEMYHFKGDQKKAREYLQKGLIVSTAIRYQDLRSHIYNVLSETYKKENNFRKAYEYVITGRSLRDSIFNEQKSKQLIDLQTRYETEKKENEIKFLRQENELKDLSLRQNRLFNLGLIIVVLALLIVGYLWQNRIKLKQRAELEATRASLRESQLQAVITSQEDERKRFAADLHDGLGQIISALRLNLSKENPQKSTVDYALGLLNDMNVEIRNIAFNLMPQSLVKDGLAEALKEFAKRLNRAGGSQISVQAFQFEKEISPDQKIALYRICQEWVNNVIKYSNSNRISIQIVQHHDELVLTIEDDGEGFDVKRLLQGHGNGWKNINSRAGVIKGNIEIDSAPGRKGTTVVVTAPLFEMV